MEDLARIEAKLGSFAELGDLIGALRSMAASRAREAQEAFAGAQSYRTTVGSAIAAVLPLARSRATPERGGRALIVVTSENGFVGGYNNRLVDRAEVERADGERLVIVGRRGQVSASERGLLVDLAFAMTARAEGVTAVARRIAAGIGEAGKVRILHAEHRPQASSEIALRQTLPLAATQFEADTPPVSPLLHLAPDRLLDQLSREYVFAEIAAALMESLAAENTARLRTMDAASRNIEDRLDGLRRQERAARQEETTADMLDVVIGAEAVSRA